MLQKNSNTQNIEFSISPAFFVQWVIVIELFVPTLSFLFSIETGFEKTYQPVVGLSFANFTILLMAIIQIMIILLAFAIWYIRKYKFTMEQIQERRFPIATWRTVLNTQSIEDILVKQGHIARYFDFGTLQLVTPEKTYKLDHIPHPQERAKQLRQLVAPKDRAMSIKQQPFSDLLAFGEGQYLEYKSSFVWDYHQKSANKALRLSVIKSLAAFMNSSGGILLVGVDDQGKVLGIEQDFVALRKKDADGWENSFNAAFSQMIGAEFRHFVTTTFKRQDNLTVCIFSVEPTRFPVFVTNNGIEEFYVRAGNGTQSLSLRNALRYILSRSPSF